MVLFVLREALQLQIGIELYRSHFMSTFWRMCSNIWVLHFLLWDLQQLIAKAGFLRVSCGQALVLKTDLCVTSDGCRDSKSPDYIKLSVGVLLLSSFFSEVVLITIFAISVSIIAYLVAGFQVAYVFASFLSLLAFEDALCPFASIIITEHRSNCSGWGIAFSLELTSPNFFHDICSTPSLLNGCQLLCGCNRKWTWHVSK